MKGAISRNREDVDDKPKGNVQNGDLEVSILAGGAGAKIRKHADWANNILKMKPNLYEDPY